MYSNTPSSLLRTTVLSALVVITSFRIQKAESHRVNSGVLVARHVDVGEAGKIGNWRLIHNVHHMPGRQRQVIQIIAGVIQTPVYHGAQTSIFQFTIFSRTILIF